MPSPSPSSQPHNRHHSITAALGPRRPKPRRRRPFDVQASNLTTKERGLKYRHLPPSTPACLWLRGQPPAVDACSSPPTRGCGTARHRRRSQVAVARRCGMASRRRFLPVVFAITAAARPSSSRSLRPSPSSAITRFALAPPVAAVLPQTALLPGPPRLPQHSTDHTSPSNVAVARGRSPVLVTITATTAAIRHHSLCPRTTGCRSAYADRPLTRTSTIPSTRD